MEDYPRTLAEFEACFSTEAACREYLVGLRWPDGFRCPRCGGRKSWPVRGVLLQCGVCEYQSSVTAGTIFQDTRKPLTVWFRAMWAVTSQKNGASAIGLHLRRQLGLEAVHGFPHLEDAGVWRDRPLSTAADEKSYHCTSSDRQSQRRTAACRIRAVELISWRLWQKQRVPSLLVSIP